MPCDGPSYKQAQKRAIRVNREVWKILHCDLGVLVDEKYGCSADKIRLMKELLTKIIWEDMSNGF